MKTTAKMTQQSASITLSRAEFEKISAVEGIHVSSELSSLLQKYMDDDLNHDQCRKKLIQHFQAKQSYLKT